MPEQLSFAGFGAAPAPTDGLFFAIRPDADARVRIAERTRRLRAEHGLRGAPLAAERLHVSLPVIGEYAGLP